MQTEDRILGTQIFLWKIIYEAAYKMKREKLCYVIKTFRMLYNSTKVKSFNQLNVKLTELIELGRVKIRESQLDLIVKTLCKIKWT